MDTGSSETRVRTSPSSHPIDPGGFAPGTILADRYRIVALAFWDFRNVLGKQSAFPASALDG